MNKRNVKSDKCVLMFSGGRDSSIAAVRLAKRFNHLCLVTILSEHLVGLDRVYTRIEQLKSHLPEETDWMQVILPKPPFRENLLDTTCLPCQRAYICAGVIIARGHHTPHVAMGYSGYQNTWPEQTPYATSRLEALLRGCGFHLHLPVYDILKKEDAISELSRLGLPHDSHEQKCLRQASNVYIEGEILRAEIDRWIDGISRIIDRGKEINLQIRFHGTLRDIGETDNPRPMPRLTGPKAGRRAAAHGRGGRTGSLQLPKRIHDEILRHAECERPLEACGLLAGRDNRVTRIFPMRNIDESGTHFFLDPEEQFSVVKKAREAGLEIVAAYHSHPTGPPAPSAEDIRLALDPDLVHVIVSLAGPETAVRAFRINNRIQEVRVTP